MSRKRISRKRMSPSWKANLNIAKISLDTVEIDDDEMHGELKSIQGASARKIVPRIQHFTFEDSESEEEDSSDDDEENSNQDTEPVRNLVWGRQELNASLRVCSVCLLGTLSLTGSKDSRHGWDTKVSWLCSNSECSSGKQIWYPTSKYENHVYEINKALVLGMRAKGKGRSAAAKLSAYLDLPAPLHYRHWRRHTRELAETVSECVEANLDSAALKLKRYLLQDNAYVRLDDDDQLRDTLVYCSVSVDGSWMTRGFYCRHGFVTVVSLDTGECIDRIYMCSTCTACKKWEGKSKS